jgi:hypothetical protein
MWGGQVPAEGINGNQNRQQRRKKGQRQKRRLDQHGPPYALHLGRLRLTSFV